MPGAHRSDVEGPCRGESNRSHSPGCENAAPHEGTAGCQVGEDLVSIESYTCLLCTCNSVGVCQSSRMYSLLGSLIWALQMQARNPKT